MWKKASLNKKVAGCLGVLLLMIGAMAAIFLWTLNSLSDDVERIVRAESMVSTMAARELDHVRWISALQAFVLDEEQKELKIQGDPAQCAFGKWYYGEGRSRAEAIFPAIHAELVALEEPHAALHQSAAAVREHKDRGDIQGATEVFQKASAPAMSLVQQGLNKINDLMIQEREAAVASFEAASSRATLIILGSGGLGVLLALFMIFVMSRSVTRPVLSLAAFADSVAHGNYENRSRIDSQDELGRLGSSVNQMVDNMVASLKLADDKAAEAAAQTAKAEEAVKQAEEAHQEAAQATRRGMHEAAAQLEAIVNETVESCSFLSGNVEQAMNGAREQLAHAGDTAAAMTQMNCAILEVARNSGEAAGSAEDAKNTADKGSALVEQTIKAIGEVHAKSVAMATAMDELGQQTQGISQVMDVISDIADQTNLLALNAAIEAARAGEAGRGFAVVADEVRKLAEKTMQATSEVGGVIQSLQQSAAANIKSMQDTAGVVESSTDLAKEAGSALAQILDVASETALKVAAIATASEEQSATSEEINRGTERINALADSNSDLMRQAGDAVTRLLDLTRNIESLVENFKKA
ncbi:methyl-accepting chemotaxis protein [Desulfovibrio sp. OttesenSCG-928-G11]|nr:methyl-accepting chemotaxis protein [Desulfovibrio sp. OttesenSCG-928-G11]